ncbi:MAG: glycosyltransferase [Tenericutes bacterium]|nr:glycosyltransferase [Mycoplasmatota bacterium]
MKKCKICVYAIAKNESKFVQRFYDSVKEADEICILDTGSEDDTVKLLRKLGVNVYEEKIIPWRFDVARNRSLDLVSDDIDICICLDLDEVLLPGWREEIEKAWEPNVTKIIYNYNWLLDKDDKPLVNFYYEKIHSRHGYKWIYPVHEVLTYVGEGDEIKKLVPSITVNHYPDIKKSRSSYLPLLELSVKENPLDDRNMHYLGREYMYYGKWDQAIDTLIKHLNLKSATWKDERAASMRFISRCYIALRRYDEAKMWLDKAIREAPYLRDAYVERAMLEYQLGNYQDVIKYAEDALKIKNKPKTYINEIFSFDNTIYDVLSIAYYYLGNKEKAVFYVNLATKMNPSDERLKNNKKIFLEDK